MTLELSELAIDVPTDLLQTASSGSVGDLVFSRNQHGPYTRARTAPVDPGSAQQVAVRAALSQCVTAWNATLTETERTSWDVHALAVRTRTALGRSTNAGGLAMFVRANVPRIQATVGASPRVDQAPALFTSPPITPITRVVANFLDDTVHPFFSESDPWISELGAALILWASRPQPTTVNFFKGPYRLAGRILGGTPILPTSPGTIALPFPIVAGERLFVRLRLTTGDARLTSSVYLQATPPPSTRPVPILATFTAGAPATIDVQFDQILRNEFHATAPWAVRWNNSAYATVFAATVRDTIRLSANNVGPDFGINRVSYVPPPRDLHGLLNGLLVRLFIDFPLT